jgi:hypothetical protein
MRFVLGIYKKGIEGLDLLRNFSLLPLSQIIRGALNITG